MQTLLALVVLLALSLFGNAWQWANRSAGKATAQGEVTRLVDINQGNDQACAEVTARMWELAGESAQLEVAITRGADKLEQLTKQLLADRAKRSKELDDAYQTDACAALRSVPVCPAISRLYTAHRLPDENR